MTAQLTLHQCLQHILNIYIRYLFTITLPSKLTLLFIYASFTQCDIFSQLLHNWLYNNVYSISATYTYSTVYNYSPMYTGFAVYICCPFHNVIFFHNHCPIHSTTMLQHILNRELRYTGLFTRLYIVKPRISRSLKILQFDWLNFGRQNLCLLRYII